jgi:Flp pilus assembly protein TadG
MAMNRRHAFRALRLLGRDFARAEGGNVFIPLGLSLIPLIGLIGAAVDYTHASAVRTALQAAVDSTSLYLSKSAATSSASALQSTAQQYLQAIFTRKDVPTPSVTVTYSNTNGSQVVVTANTTMDTSLVRVLRIKYSTSSLLTQIPIAASSTSQWGNTRLRVALVLDNTGSMNSSGKLSALKTATNNLLSQLKTAATTPDDVYVSIIPFVRDVNADRNNYNAIWIDWTDWEAEPPILDPARGGSKPSSWAQTGPGSTCPFGTSKNPQSTSNYGFNCLDALATSGGKAVDNIPSSGTSKGLICPSMDTGGKNAVYGNIFYNGCYDSTTYSCTGSSCTCNGHANCSCRGSGAARTCATNPGYYEHTWRPVANLYATPDHSTWNGCIADRGFTTGPDTSGNYDTNVSAPSSGIKSTLFPAQQYSVCAGSGGLQPMMSLTNNWTSLSNLVNAMVANGSTNQAIGLALGWQSLVGGGPFPTPPAMDSNYQYKQVIILLTDGLNTQDRWYGNGSSTATQVDARQKLTCSNVKNAGVTLYAIQVNTDGSPTSTLLQNCAGTNDPSAQNKQYFFLLTASSQIDLAFQQIAKDITQLRIAK